MKGSEKLSKKKTKASSKKECEEKAKVLDKLKDINAKAKKNVDNKIDIINKGAFLKFNGDKLTSSGIDNVKLKVQACVKAKDRIMELYNGCNKSNIKEINALAKDILTEEEIQSAIQIAEIEKKPQYYAKLTLIKSRLDSILDDINSGAISDKTLNLKEIVQQAQDELDKGKMVEENNDDDNMVVRQEIEEFEEILKNPEIAKLNLENDLKEKDDIVEPKLDESKLSVKVDKDKMEEDKLNVDKDMIEFQKALDQIEKGEIVLDIKNRNDRMNDLFLENAKANAFLTNSVNVINARNFAAVDNINQINEENLNFILSKPCGLDNVKKIMDHMQKTKLTVNERLLLVMIKSLYDNILAIKGSIQSQAKAIEHKEEVNNKIQMEVLKNDNKPAAVQMKKIIRKSYIPEEEWKKLDTIQKSLRQIRDWDQFPRYNIWLNYSEDQKVAFMKERLKWNKRRMEFLMNIAQNKKDDNPENWPKDINVGSALTNQLYYSDKFSRGNLYSEFKNIYVQVEKKIREEYLNTRNKARAFIQGLANKKQLGGFVYCKNVRIGLNNKPFWEIDLVNIADTEIERARKEEESYGYRGSKRNRGRGKNARGRGRGGYEVREERREEVPVIPKGDENFY